MQALPEHGVPLETLQAFAKVAKDIAHSAKRPALSTKQLVREVILPLCALHKCSFVDLLCGAEKGAKARNAYVAKKKEERKNAVDSKVKATANALAKKVVLPDYPVGDKKYVFSPIVLPPFLVCLLVCLIYLLLPACIL